MLVGSVVVYKVMKKVGKLTEARMVLPPEPKIYPLVSDSLFEAKVKFKGRKKLKEDDLPMNRRGRITQAGPAPKVDPKTYQTYNSMTDAKDPNWIQGAEADIERRGTEGKCTPITKPGCTGKAKALAKTFKKMAKKRDDSTKAKNEAKDDNWIQGAEADIERRGTEGKCTPITKPGCTGKAKALAKTFKKMAKKRDAKIVSKKEKQNEGIQRLGRVEKSLNKSAADTAEKSAKLRKQRHAGDDPATNPVGTPPSSAEVALKKKGEETAKKQQAVAAKLASKKKDQQRRARNTASNPDTPLDTAIRAGDALDK